MNFAMINDHLNTWLGYEVKLLSPENANEKIEYGKYIYRLAIGWDDEMSTRDLIYSFVQNPKCVETPGIVIGAFSGDDTDMTTEGVVELLVTFRAKFPKLKGIFLGDILSEENEISWIQQSDISPLFTAYPELEHFRVRGGNGLSLGKINHRCLKSLVIETGGMDRAILEELANSELPNLEHLELWLGTDNYGWNGSLADVLPLMTWETFPKLKYLGLKNSDLENQIAEAILKTNILPQLETLDLSLGVLGDEGAEALLASDQLSHLKKLDLSHHYISKGLQAKLKAKYPQVNLSGEHVGKDYADVEDRYVSVGE